MKTRDAIRLIETDGWLLVRTRGSHRHFKHPTKPGLVTIAGQSGVDIPKGTMNSILKQSGLKDRPMRYAIVIERGDTSYGAYVPDLPGCVAVGRTREEAVKLIHEAIEDHLELLREDGEPVPEPRSTGDYAEVAAA